MAGVSVAKNRENASCGGWGTSTSADGPTPGDRGGGDGGAGRKSETTRLAARATLEKTPQLSPPRLPLLVYRRRAGACTALVHLA